MGQSPTAPKNERKIMNRQKTRKVLILISFWLFPITIFYFSPVLPIEGAVQGIVVGSLVVFVLQFVLSLFLGRAFCGWVCPGSGLQESCQIATTKPVRAGRGDWIKYAIWLPWIAAIIALFVSAKGVREVDILFFTHNGVSVMDPYSYCIYFVIIALMAVPALTSGRRAFCHYICWMAPFMVIGSKLSRLSRLPSLRLIAGTNMCISCKSCNKVCQMSLDVNAMAQSGRMENTECILCGECSDVCPKNVICYSFSFRAQEYNQTP